MSTELKTPAGALAVLDGIFASCAADVAGSALALEQRAVLGPLAPLVERLLAGPQPGESLLRLRRLCDAPEVRWPADPARQVLLADVISSGPSLTRDLVRHPARLSVIDLRGTSPPWTRTRLADAFTQAVAGVTTHDELATQAARFRADHMVRLAADEFAAVPLEQVGHDLATLADVILDGVLAWVLAEMTQAEGPPLCERSDSPTDHEPCGLCAIAMGKYGAEELNFCSDIDIVFVYKTDDGQAGPLSLHEFFDRVCQRATRIVSAATVEGNGFRVDLRLRPEGNQGPICNAVASAERFYETWGGPYDRLAWLKARPAAGDLAVGAAMIEILAPFVFPRTIRPEVVGDLQALYQRLTVEAQKEPGAWNVKIGAGGIRAVEFFVQALQLLHAGKEPALRERSTLRALTKLLHLGQISANEHQVLAEGYDLFRRIEHRLQLYDGRQTHSLPDHGPRREHVAAHLGYGSVAAFDVELAARRREVTRVYETLAVERDADGPGKAGDAAHGAAVHAQKARVCHLLRDDDGTAAQAELRGALAELGFADPARAAELFATLGSRKGAPFGRAPSPAASRLEQPLVRELASSPDPDAALGHLVALAARFGPHGGLFRLLDGNRQLLRVLATLFGSSDHLARLFVEHPERVDQLLLAGRAELVPGAASLSQELGRELAAVADDDLEAQLNVLGRFRSAHTLRIGLGEMAGDLCTEAVQAELSQLADQVLTALYPLVRREVARRFGLPRDADGRSGAMAILGLGSLGGRELIYGSDLDLVFVYSGDGETDGARSIGNAEFFTRVAQLLIRSLTMPLAEGQLYAVDTRLRPSGNQGTLVTSLAALARYHQTAAGWERQALLKARGVAGDAAFVDEVTSWVGSYVYQAVSAPSALRAEIDAHRARFEKELAGETGGFYNLKLGRGGLLDIDFVAQFLQLVHGAHTASLRVPTTLVALSALGAAQYLASDDAAALLANYRFLRTLESRLRIVRDRSAERLPKDAEGLEVMARRLGYRRQGARSAGARLVADYQQVTAANRRIYDKIMRSDPTP